ncbi:MAG: mevalonate kinase [Candidatus Caldarchaeum sp.]
MRKQVKVFAPGKVILYGEHFVVSGYPAIVTAIDRGVTVTARKVEDKFVIVSKHSAAAWDISGEPIAASSHTLAPLYNMVREICLDNGVPCTGLAEIESDLVSGGGLGSSAAVSVALAKAVSLLHEIELSRDQLIQYALKAEKEFHGRPSGIDPTISAVGGTIAYQGLGKYTGIEIGEPLDLIIVFSGRKRKTSKMVDFVQRFAAEKKNVFTELVKLYSYIYEEAKKSLAQGDLETIGQLFTLNHLLLKTVGVSAEVLENIVDRLRSLCVYGSKLTGAGGGGCVIAVAGERTADIVEEMSRLYPGAWLSRIGVAGVGEKV